MTVQKRGAKCRAEVRYLAIAVVVGIVAAATPTSRADNPANFSFDLTTTGNDVFFNSAPVFVDPGFPSYDYLVDFTALIVTVDTGLGEVDFDFTDQVTDVAGNFGSLPAVLVNEVIDEPGVITVTVFIGVDANGFTDVSLTNVTLGQFSGFDITKVRAAGDVTLTGIPEPATAGLMLATAGLLFGTGRRHRRQ